VGKFIDLVGQVFWRLTVVRLDGRDKRGNTLWGCACECGKEVVVYGYNLKNNHTKSCGCFKEQVQAETSITHGLCGTPQYKSWSGAKDRVTSPGNQAWKNYGGRGITMCQEWLDSFEAFWRDMGGSYKKGLTIERKDTNGNYCPENCVWETESRQNHNRRKWKGCSSQYKGVSFSRASSKYRAEIRANGKRNYIGVFTNEIDAAIAYDNASEELYGDRPNGTEVNYVKKEAPCS